MFDLITRVAVSPAKEETGGTTSQQPIVLTGNFIFDGNYESKL